MSVMITDLDILKNHLDIGSTDSGEDNRLQQMLNEAEEVIFGQVGRNAELYSSTSIQEFHSGGGREKLFTRARPLTKITSLNVDPTGYFGKGTDPFNSTTDWTEGVDFVASREDENEENRGQILAIHRVFPDDKGNVKLVYEAGYAALPADLEFAIVQLVSLFRSGAEKGQILGSETFGKYAYRVMTGGTDATGQQRGIIGTVNTTLSRYRNIRV